TKGCSTVQWRFALVATIPHEAVCFSPRFRDGIRVRTAGQQHFDDFVIYRTVGLAQRVVEWRFPGGAAVIDVGTVFDEELAKLPTAVKRGAAEIEVLAQRDKRFAARQQESDRAHVSVVGAPLDERHSTLIHGSRRMALRQVVKDEIRSPVCNPVDHVSPRLAFSSSSAYYLRDLSGPGLWEGNSTDIVGAVIPARLYCAAPFGVEDARTARQERT